MMAAADCGDLDTVRLLLSHGAKLEAVNAVGVTSLVFAEAIERQDIVKLLKRRPDLERPSRCSIM